MDGSQKASTTLKNSSPSQWSSNIEWTTDWYTISNKTTGTTSLAVRINSNDGVRDATYTYSMAVDPAHFTQTPKVEYQSATTTSATFKWTTSENASTVKYILDGGSEVSCFSGNAATGTFTITELTSNTSHTLKINAQRKDSGLWSYSEQISFNTSNKTVRIRVNNVWEDATPYIRVNGEWEQTTPYIRINNEWKRGK